MFFEGDGKVTLGARRVFLFCSAATVSGEDCRHKTKQKHPGTQGMVKLDGWGYIGVGGGGGGSYNRWAYNQEGV